MTRICKSKCINRLAQEAYCRKKVNRKLLRFRKSWDEVRKIINAKSRC